MISGLPQRNVSCIPMDPTPLQAQTPISIISCQVNHVKKVKVFPLQAWLWPRGWVEV